MNIQKTQRMAPHVRFPFGFRGVVFSVMAIGLSAAMLTAFTGAVFTDTATSTGNIFTAGAALDIKLTDANETLLDDVTASLSSSSMLPGDVVSGLITVKNTNTYSVRFAMSGKLSGLPSPKTVSSNALSVSYAISAASVANPTVITTASNPLITGDSVTITGSDSTPSIDGTFTVTVLTATTFTIPVNVTVAGTTGTVAFTTPITVVTTSAAHGLNNDDYVVITGSNSTPTLNGTRQVKKLTATTFRVPLTVTVAGTAGTVQPELTAFGQALTIDVWRQATGSPATDPADCANAVPTGTQVVTAAAFGANDGASQNQIGNPNQGAQAGDIALTGGQDTILCFHVSLPLSTGNSVAGQTQTTTWTFAAEQVANNP